MSYFDDPQQGHTNDSLTAVGGVTVSPGVGIQNIYLGPQPSVPGTAGTGPGLQPYHQSLLLLYKAGGNQIKPFVQIVGTSSGITYYVGYLSDMGQAFANQYGRFPLSIPVVGAFDSQILIMVSGSGAGPQGTLYVAASSTSHIVTPRPDPIPPVLLAASVAVAPATTVAILPFPAVGTFYRIRMFSWQPNAAGAAGGNLFFSSSVTGQVLWLAQWNGALGNWTQPTPCLIDCAEGVNATNNEGANISMAVTSNIITLN